MAIKPLVFKDNKITEADETILIEDVATSRASFISGEALSALKVFRITDSGKGFLCTSNGTFEEALPTGIVFTAASGPDVEFRGNLFGIMEDASWNWTANQLLFLGLNGSITDVPPSTGFLTVIGKTLTATKILIQFKEPLQL